MRPFEETDKRPNPRWPGIRGRIALTFGAMSVLLSLCLALIVGYVSKAQLEAQSGNALAELAYQMADTLDRGMFERYRQLSLLSDLSPLRLGAEQRSRELFAHVHETYPEYAWLGLANPDGRIIAGTGGLLEGQDLSGEAWFREGWRAPYIGDVREAPRLAPLLPGMPLMLLDLAVPIIDLEKRPSGVLVAQLNWRWAADMRDSLLRDRENLDMLILSREGNLLLAPDGTPALERKLLERMRQGAQGYRLVETSDGAFLSGFALSQGHRTYPGLGWLIVVRQDVGSAFAGAVALQRQIVLWGLTLGAAFALLGLSQARRLAEPIWILADAADRVQQGDRHLHLPTFQIREFSRLASSLTNMVATLTSHEQDLKEANESLERRVQERTRELQSTQAKLREVAYRDALTGLPNRLMFQEQLRQSMGYASQYGRKMAVMFLDLDRFKEINDTLGHDAGDLLLKQVAQRLSACVRGGDVVARLAGDEFTVILNDVQDDSDVRVVAHRVVTAQSQPFDLVGSPVRIAASVGISCFPADGNDVNVLLKKADVAMYLAKRQQNGYQFYAAAYEQARG